MKKLICLGLALFSLSSHAAETKTAEELGKVLIYSLLNEGDQPAFNIDNLTLNSVVVDKNDKIDQLIFKSYDYTEFVNCGYDAFFDKGYCDELTCEADIIVDVNPRGKSSYRAENIDCYVGSGRGNNQWQR